MLCSGSRYTCASASPRECPSLGQHRSDGGLHAASASAGQAESEAICRELERELLTLQTQVGRWVGR
jgi:hypothetical protein